MLWTAVANALTFALLHKAAALLRWLLVTDCEYVGESRVDKRQISKVLRRVRHDTCFQFASQTYGRKTIPNGPVLCLRAVTDDVDDVNHADSDSDSDSEDGSDPMALTSGAVEAGLHHSALDCMRAQASRLYVVRVELRLMTGAEHGRYLAVTVYRLRGCGPLVEPMTTARRDVPPPDNRVTVLRRVKDDYTSRCEIARPRLCPTLPESLDAAKRIIRLWLADDRQGRFILYGVPGCGKSMTGRILAQALGAVLVTNFNPSRKDELFDTVISQAEPQRYAPLVIVVNEYDQILQGIRRRHESGSGDGTVPDARVEMWDKTSHNNALDDLMMLPDVLVLLTSNWSVSQFDEFDAWDASFMRPGRITARVTMGPAHDQDALSLSGPSTPSVGSPPPSVKPIHVKTSATHTTASRRWR